jgi:hypothetical protein
MSRTLPFKLNAVEGVGAGQEAWVKLTNGPTYQQIVIESNIPPAEMEKVSIDMGGVHNEGVIVEALGTELVTKDKYKGNYTTSSAPFFYLVELGQLDGKTDSGQMFSGLVTLPSDNIRLLFDQADTLTPTTPYIKVEAWASESQPYRRYIPSLRPQTIIVNSTGEQSYLNLPTKGGLKYRRLWLKGGGLKVVEVKKDGARKYFGRKESVEYMQRILGLVPQATWFVVDFCERGFVFSDLFDPRHINSLELNFDAGTAENVRCLVEGVKDLGKDNYQS